MSEMRLCPLVVNREGLKVSFTLVVGSKNWSKN